MNEPVPSTSSAAWVSDAASRWAAVADQLEAQLTPVSELLFAAAGLRPGERVVDVGCGRGETTREAAVRTAPNGRVTGVDIAANLLDEARARTPPSLTDRIGWIEGDAQRTEALGPASFDVVLSRFGVMFFDDPVDAFATLAAATVPGGRLCLAVWPNRERTELLQHPIDVARRAAATCGRTLEITPPDGGAFSLGEREVAADVLTRAGWRDIRARPTPFTTYLGGPGPVDQACHVATAVGALRVALEALDAATVEAVHDALRADLASRHDGTGVRIGGEVMVITARR